MKSITILTSYFGEFNNYHDLWLKAVEANPSIDFKLLTDNDVLKAPKNMTVVKMSFSEMQEKVRAFFDFPIVIDTGYKMSEYQPLFALIFPELVEGADFWGYCETDLILGNLRNFFTEEKLRQYDKLYYLGHLTIYRNIDEINRLALLEHKFPTATYRQAFTTSYNYHFIEHAMRDIAKYSGVRCYDEIEFGDISYKYNHFVLGRGTKCGAPQIFMWQNGNIWRIFLDGNTIVREECAYVHLQKRKMNVTVKYPERGYLIVPNEFIDLRAIKADDLVNWSKDSLERRIWYYKFYIKYYWETLKVGGLKIKYDKMMRKAKYGKIPR